MDSKHGHLGVHGLPVLAIGKGRLVIFQRLRRPDWTVGGKSLMLTPYQL
jgi:hypothetical protein